MLARGQRYGVWLGSMVLILLSGCRYAEGGLDNLPLYASHVLGLQNLPNSRLLTLGFSLVPVGLI